MNHTIWLATFCYRKGLNPIGYFSSPLGLLKWKKQRTACLSVVELGDVLFHWNKDLNAQGGLDSPLHLHGLRGACCLGLVRVCPVSWNSSCSVWFEEFILGQCVGFLPISCLMECPVLRRTLDALLRRSHPCISTDPPVQSPSS